MTKNKSVDLNQIRTAVADYIGSEGCSCCEGENHRDHLTTLAKLLGVKDNGTFVGYDFTAYQTKRKPS